MEARDLAAYVVPATMAGFSQGNYRFHVEVGEFLLQVAKTPNQPVECDLPHPEGWNLSLFEHSSAHTLAMIINEIGHMGEFAFTPPTKPGQPGKLKFAPKALSAVA